MVPDKTLNISCDRDIVEPSSADAMVLFTLLNLFIYYYGYYMYNQYDCVVFL